MDHPLTGPVSHVCNGPRGQITFAGTGLRCGVARCLRDSCMTDTSQQPSPGSVRKWLVVVALFAIAIAFYLASFLVAR